MYMVGADGNGVVQVPMTTYTLVEGDRRERGNGGGTLYSLNFEICYILTTNLIKASF